MAAAAAAAAARILADLHAVTGWHTLADVVKEARRHPHRFIVVLEGAADHTVDALIANPSHETFLTQTAGSLLALASDLRAAVRLRGSNAVVQGWGSWVGAGYDTAARLMWLEPDRPVPLPMLKIEALRGYVRLLDASPPLTADAVHASVTDRLPGECLGNDMRPRWVSDAGEWDSLIRCEILALERAIAESLADRRGRSPSTAK